MIKKKVIILDDEPLISALVKEVLEEDLELEISQSFTDRFKFMESVEKDFCDAAIIDVSIGGREGGLELVRILKTKNIELPLIILSAHDEYTYAFKCLQAGAKAYVSKSYVCTDLVQGLKEVLKGNLFVSSEKGPLILKQYADETRKVLSG